MSIVAVQAAGQAHTCRLHVSTDTRPTCIHSLALNIPLKREEEGPTGYTGATASTE